MMKTTITTTSKMSTEMSTTARAVTFSPWSEMAVIPKEKMKLAERWYSTEDHARFKQELIRDVQGVSRVIATTPADMLTQDELHECIGIESFLNQDLLRHLQAKKRAHVRAIVIGQRIYNEEELSLVSKISSRWARDGAHFRAKGFSNDWKLQG